MREAVIVASVRTAIGKSFRGSLNLTRPDDLAAHCIRHLLAGVPRVNPEEVEDVTLGCAFPHGPQGWNVARNAALLAGLPFTTAAVTVNRFCASGLQSIVMAAHSVIHEGIDIAIAGGVESISLTPGPLVDPNPGMAAKCPAAYAPMGETAEWVARKYGISRGRQDDYALLSQRRTAQAQVAGIFDEEIAPMRVTRGIYDRATGKTAGTEETVFREDECNRPGTTLESLALLRPMFDGGAGDGTVTAGNSSQLADGASVVLVMSKQRALQLNITPRLIFRGFGVAGCDPREMGIGPVLAVPKLLTRLGLRMGEIDLVELNEAFAVQVVYCCDRLGLDLSRVNVNGGAIAMGHPYGMSGARMVGTLANELRRRALNYGIVTMCVGGGQGAASLWEAYS
jgi:acetyl-CoA acyltransferase